MTKQEVINEVNKALEELDNFDTTINELKDYAKAIRSKLENLPETPSEIEDSEKEDED